VRFCVEADPERKDDPEGSDEEGEMLILSPEEETRLAKQRQKKMKLRLAKDRFNAEGKKSFGFLQGLKLLADPLTPESVVTFFANTPGLDKTRIGEILGGSDDLSVKVLSHFCSTFDFEKLVVIGQSGEGQVRKTIHHDIILHIAQHNTTQYLQLITTHRITCSSRWSGEPPH
jgi:hypothetical protein